jgi:RNA methyltransferase, TrmH family
MTTTSRTARFRDARRDGHLVVIEGFHALKHALRFGAEILEAVTTDPAGLRELSGALAPDLASRLSGVCEEIEQDDFAGLADHLPRTGVIAIARRPEVVLAAVLADPRPAPIVVLEDPRNLGNLGACIRVAAAADAAGVLVTGTSDPWHPDAIRGAAGLQFALPVVRVDDIPSGERPWVAVDPDGEPPGPGLLDRRALLIFGSERHGLSLTTRTAADRCVAIPMREGVSSLNLATSVAAVLYSFGG